MSRILKIFLTVVFFSYFLSVSSSPTYATQLDWFVRLFRNDNFRSREHEKQVSPLYQDNDARQDLASIRPPVIPEFGLVTGAVALTASAGSFIILKRRKKA